MRARLLALFALVGIIWGSEWLVTRDLDSPPLGALALRYAMAAVVLGAIFLVRRIPLPMLRMVVISAITGITFAAAPVLLIGWARERVSPGLLVVIFAMTPLIAALMEGRASGGFLISLVGGVAGTALPLRRDCRSPRRSGRRSSVAGGRGVDCGVGDLREEATRGCAGCDAGRYPAGVGRGIPGVRELDCGGPVRLHLEWKPGPGGSGAGNRGWGPGVTLVLLAASADGELPVDGFAMDCDRDRSRRGSVAGARGAGMETARGRRDPAGQLRYFVKHPAGSGIASYLAVNRAFPR